MISPFPHFLVLVLTLMTLASFSEGYQHVSTGVLNTYGLVFWV